MSALTIYKASAGSGKTFTLAREYLKIMFSSDKAFAGILAVTFTKKATAEMSERILSELYLLASGNESGHLSSLIEEYKLSENEVRQKADFYLKRILHNYHWFNISTIDSFLQGILKSFTREVGLNAGFNVELNQHMVIEEAVAIMFDKLHENENLRRWLYDFAKDKLDAGKSWDIQKELVEFAKTALKDHFYSLSQNEINEIADIEKFAQYKKELQEIINSFSQEVINIGIEAVRLIEQHNLCVDDFNNGKTGVAGYMQKLSTLKFFEIGKEQIPKARVRNAANSDDGITGWVKKKSPKELEIQACVNNGLHKLVLNVVDLFDNKSEDFFTARAILKEIDSYAILVEIFKEVINYCTEQNIFLLSMSSPLLANIVGKDDTSFIYEKTGQFLKSFMIDEFQDTSLVQWNNFFPLVLNSISENNRSLVVGDIKQSIYRFRNGDWTLLDSQIKNQFAGYGVNEETLPNNWRSFGNVVEFNNCLFETSPQILQNYFNSGLPEEFINELHTDTFIRIFNNSSQLIPQEKKIGKGKVTVNFCNKTKEDDIESFENQYDEFLSKMDNAILELNEAGYAPGQIAILVRTGKEGAMVADYLMKKSLEQPHKADVYSFISSDSVFLKSSVVIQAIVSILQLVELPDNSLFKANVLFLTNKLNGNKISVSDLLITENILDNDHFLSLLPSQLVELFEELKHKSLLESVYSINGVFEILGYVTETDYPFINTFFDQILVLVNKGKFDSTSFLQWWSENGHVYPVQISEQKNSMRIITIHKSKGLEFDAVIMPFVTWDMGMKNRNVIWCETKGVFNKISRVPVNAVKELEYTQFRNKYYNELLLTYVDNINVLYVAVTRAKKAMYINALLPSNEDKISNSGALLYKSIIDNTILNNYFNKDSLAFVYGELEPQEKVSDNKENTPVKAERVQSKTNKLNVRIHDIEYYKTEPENDKAGKGRIFHKIMEEIKYISDIDNTINKMVIYGELSEKESLQIGNLIKNTIKESGKEAWFMPGAKVYNERSVVLSNGILKRPDRYMIVDGKHIVVDYKFTEQASASHKHQVREYMHLLKNMGDNNIEGYVWYFQKGELIPV